MLPELSYIICTNPRSGSWLLAAALTSTCLAGNVREWFEDKEQQKYCDKWKIVSPTLQMSYEEYYHHFLKEGTGSNKIFGMKLMAYQFPGAIKKLATIPALKDKSTDYQMLTAAFPNTKYIWLIRQDKIRQAVSHAKAQQTDIWWDMEGIRQEPRPAYYDEKLINSCYKQCIEHENVWRDYFKQNQITPLVISYEDLADNYEQNIRRVLEFLGVDEGKKIKIAPPRHKKQADELSEEWVARYTLFIEQQARQS
jgi:LPS sulfotransferase NodH